MTGELLLSLNGEMMPASEARVSPFDRGFMWGDGVYEVTPCYNGALFRLDDHVARLYRSLRYVQIDPGLSTQALRARTLALHEANAERVDAGEIYRVGHWITRGEDSATMSVRDAGPATVLIFYRPVDLASVVRVHREGVRLTVVPTRRNPPTAVEARAKVTSKINQVLAELDAASRGALSLMLDFEGNVAENSSANLFMVRDGALWTAPGRNVLEGVTRMVVLDLARGAGLPVHERTITMYDLAQADELFLTASTRGLVPVSAVDRFVPTQAVPGPVTRQLMALYAEACGYDFAPAAQPGSLAASGSSRGRSRE